MDFVRARRGADVGRVSLIHSQIAIIAYRDMLLLILESLLVLVSMAEDKQ